MEMFLPRPKDAAKLKVGSEARITVYYLPDRVAVGYVSFVSPNLSSPQNKSRPRASVTSSMFRVKIQVPEELVISRIKLYQDGDRRCGLRQGGRDGGLARTVRESA